MTEQKRHTGARRRDQADLQHVRFLETARALGCDGDEAVFDEKLKGIAKQGLRTEDKLTVKGPRPTKEN